MIGSYNIDVDAISVSGLSSGGFMAAQMHVIESQTFMGVGIIAGGTEHNLVHIYSIRAHRREQLFSVRALRMH